MKKRILSLVLCLVMVFSLLPFAALADWGPNQMIAPNVTGTYKGESTTWTSDKNKAVATVTLTDGKITNIVLEKYTRTTTSNPFAKSTDADDLKQFNEAAATLLAVFGNRVLTYDLGQEIRNYAINPGNDPMALSRGRTAVYNALLLADVVEAQFWITWNPNDGASATVRESVAYGATPSHDEPTRNGYVFLGWSTSPDGDVLSPLPAVSGDITYYAVWQADPETIPVEDPDDNTGGEVTLDNGTTINNPQRVNKNGLKLSKELSSANGESFDIKMESYSTANTTKTAVTEKVPTDFVVIVDQSGSMRENDMLMGQPAVVNGSKSLEDIAKGSYYVRGEDGNYYRVYAVRDYLFRYYPANTWYVGDILDRVGASRSWFQGQQEVSFDYDNQFYFQEGDTFHPITLTITGRIGTYYNKFSYTNNAGTRVSFNRDSTQYGNIVYANLLGSFGWGPTIESNEFGYGAIDLVVRGVYNNQHAYTFSEVNTLGGIININTGMYVNYPMYDRHVGYTRLAYRDVNGVEHTVSPVSGPDTATYCNASGQAITTRDGSTRMNYNNLYTASNTQTRLAALQEALTQFVTAVANEKDTKTGSISNVDNRIAIVGFSSDSSTYNNTELLTGSTFNITRGSTIPSGSGTSVDGYNYNGKQMTAATTADYAGALIDVNVDDVVGTINSKLTDAIKAVTAYGGTQPEYGFQMAKSIFDNRGTGEGKTTYQMQSVAGNPTVDRNTIVIFFTDGHPGNYDYSDMYAEANDVVEAALPLKQAGVQIFTIGVFGESDGNPLTYPHPSNGASSQDSSWQYLGGWMENVQGGNRWYALRRQWRPSNADYTETANDTIFDYMSVVSSNYTNAQDYIAPAWIAGNFSGNYVAATEGVRGSHTDSNQFYRSASSQATLVAAFTQAVTYAGAINESSSSIVLNTNSVFRDTINTEDFDITNATYTVYQQAIHVDETVTSGSMISEVGEPEELQASRAVPADGVITYSGFDYQANYVAYGHSDGYKLVVKVEGLTPKTYGTTIRSNADTDTLYACGIYEYGKDTPAISVESPTVKVLKSSSSYVADFGTPLIVATEATQIANPACPNNGEFSIDAEKNAVYELKMSDTPKAANEITINEAYAGVDSANITGKHIEDGAAATVQTQTVYVVPASNVYFSDHLGTLTISDGHGYNKDAAAKALTGEDEIAKGQYTLRFYGTGIDVYCSTETNSGIIQAKLIDDDGVMIPGTIVTVRNSTNETTRYNVPTVSYNNLAPGYHTLGLNILSTSKYKLDGIRVYNPVSDQSIYDTVERTDEKDASYFNFRDALVNDSQPSEISTNDQNALQGALFVDDRDKLNIQQPMTDENGKPIIDEETGEQKVQPFYATQFDAYKANSPKHEVYLSPSQSVTFQLTSAAAGGKLWIGLSAPDAGTNFANAYVTVNGQKISVTSGIDMYYPLTERMIGEGNSITIQNDGEFMISLTNLKVTGVPSLVPTQANGADHQAALAKAFAPVTMRTIVLAANNGVDPEAAAEEPETPSVPETPEESETPETPDTPEIIEPTVEPTAEPSVQPSVEPTTTPTKTPTLGSLVQQLISSFVNALFNSVARLFGR